MKKQKQPYTITTLLDELSEMVFGNLRNSPHTWTSITVTTPTTTPKDATTKDRPTADTSEVLSDTSLEKSRRKLESIPEASPAAYHPSTNDLTVTDIIQLLEKALTWRRREYEQQTTDVVDYSLNDERIDMLSMIARLRRGDLTLTK